MVLPTGFEPAIFAVRGRCPKPLDDGSMSEAKRDYTLKRAVGGWRLAVSGWRLAVGGWRLAVGVAVGG